MGTHSLQYMYARGRFTLPLVYFIFSFVWVFSVLFIPEQPPIQSIHTPLWNAVVSGQISWWLNQILAYLLCILISYTLIQLNNQFTIITQRATIQSSLFLLSIAAIPLLQVTGPGLVLALAVTVHTFFLFESYQDSNSMLLQFYAGVISGLLFLLLPKLIFFIPLLYLTKLAFNNLNIHTLLASLLGFLLPLWFFLGHVFWHDQLHLLHALVENLSSWHFIWEDFASLSLVRISSFLFLSICTLLSLLYLLFSGVKLRVRTRHILNHFLRLSVGIMILISLEPTLFAELAPLWVICISFTYGHALVSMQTKLTNYIFIFMLTLLVTLFSLNLWRL